MAMRALESDMSVRVRKTVDIFGETDMNAFMDTFDQAVTVTEEGWDRWLRRNGIATYQCANEDTLMATYLHFHQK